MPENTNDKQDLFSITTIREAAAAIAAFKPERLPIGKDKFVTIDKLPDDKFRELLNRFGEQITPFFEPQKDGTPRKITATDLLGFLDDAPVFVDDLLKHATDWHDLPGHAQLPTDARLICAAAVLMVSFIDNAAVRVFITAAQRVNESVGAENAAVASDAPKPTDRS